MNPTTEIMAIIGGTGFDRISGFRELERKKVETPYGNPSGSLILGQLGEREFLFLPRHGSEHGIPPHRINYRANIHALNQAGVKRVIALAAVGGIAGHMLPGDVVLPDQIVDYTWGREHTFFTGAEAGVNHIDFTWPYSPAWRQHLLAAATRAGIVLHPAGTYAVTQGPRLESAAEIDRLERDGAHIVGMTGMPEAALAKELGLEYAAIALVVNAAAGRSKESITMDVIRHNLAICSQKALEIIQHC
jgi:5'-deoxy-5'-methylthioadenosine phosphorylase